MLTSYKSKTRKRAGGLIEAKPAQKIRNFRSINKNMQVLNSSAIASGYAGRDPQGGFCDRSVYVLY